MPEGKNKMRTYDLNNKKGPVYKSLYEQIKAEILSGSLKSNEKMPSKRNFARNLGISTISVENAYDQLISEGYIYTIPKKGYYVADLQTFQKMNYTPFQPVSDGSLSSSIASINPKSSAGDVNYDFDFSSNTIETSCFPFSVWAKMVRETISSRKNELLEISPCGGVLELREAIAGHLQSFRGMKVHPDQIIVGAGTEYLYGLIVQLLGKDKIYSIENPGYHKIKKIYESNGAKCICVEMDKNGILIESLKAGNSDVAHISPAHHFPTGITMPITRRYELLAWANDNPNRYIIEDDYDSEFRINGRPIPPLQSIDMSGKVIYMNTFSKSLASTIRISYMVLPEQLAAEFYKKLSFYSCTVSTFEQYTLSQFIKQGYFEKHINRMRLHYGRKRASVMEILHTYLSENQCKIIENDSGLHFILQFNTSLSDSEIKQFFQKYNAKITSITDYDINGSKTDSHQFILNYSNMDTQKLKNILSKIDFPK